MLLPVYIVRDLKWCLQEQRELLESREDANSCEKQVIKIVTAQELRSMYEDGQTNQHVQTIAQLK